MKELISMRYLHLSANSKKPNARLDKMERKNEPKENYETNPKGKRAYRKGIVEAQTVVCSDLTLRPLSDRPPTRPTE